LIRRVGDLCDGLAINHNGSAIPFQKVIHSFLVAFTLCLKLRVPIDCGLVGVELVNENIPTLATYRDSAQVDTKATQLLELALPLLRQHLDRLCIPVFIVCLCVVGRLYSVQYKSNFGASDKVRHDTCEEARPSRQDFQRDEVVLDIKTFHVIATKQD
jgi:hypothetical protein